MNNITNANLGHAYWFADGGDPTGATRLNRSFNNTTGVFTCSGYGYCRGSDSNGKCPMYYNVTKNCDVYLIA